MTRFNRFAYHVDAEQAVKDAERRIAALTSAAAIALSADIGEAVGHPSQNALLYIGEADTNTEWRRRARVAGLTDAETDLLWWHLVDDVPHCSDDAAWAEYKTRKSEGKALYVALLDTPAIPETQRVKQLRNARASLRKWSKRSR